MTTPVAMIAGVRGRLISASFAHAELLALPGTAVAPPAIVRAPGRFTPIVTR